MAAVPPRSFRWAGPLRAAASLALALAIAFAPHARAEESRSGYRVVIDAPSALRDALQASLDLVRWQSVEDVTRDLLDRLMREAVDQAKDILATEGYFSPVVKVALDDAPRAADEPLTVKVQVEPGAASRVTKVAVRITGPAATDVPMGTDAAAKAQGSWRLPIGEIFRQEAWDDAKKSAVAVIAASPYASAAIERSEARIDPDALTAELDVDIASGPAFRFGGMEITGLKRYSTRVVRNFSTIDTGDLYQQERLDQFVRRLNTSGYFASVQASIDTDPGEAERAPIHVSVIEGPPKHFEGGLGFSTDTKVRGNFRYSDVNVDAKATQFTVDGRADSKIQNLSLRFVRPPNDDRYVDSAEAKVERSDIEGLQTLTASAGITRQTVEERNRTAYRIFYYEDDQQPDGGVAIRSHALNLELERTWRNVDDLIAPTRGYVLSTRIGGGPPGVSTRTYGRGIVQYASWHPVGRVSTINLRAEAGAVAAKSRDGIPSALLFRTGGDTTVRGYAFESLGPQVADATVGGRYYAVASAEAIRYFTPLWGMALFVDAGNAADELSSFRPAFGYGTGLRVKSPIGPLRVDIAYGQETGKVRLHMSVGVSF